ncbi:MAG: hypothetical protein HYY44_03680 [Deltaproteobacteria bacterium]|nr:hypothetical protein [Deltaproteobacteria bacterium]
MNGITQPRSSFEPTSRDYALTSALQSANPFNTGSLYRNDWDAWKQGVANRFTVAGGMEMVATSAAFFGINRFTMPRITGALNRSGVRGFWLPLLLSSTALSMVTSGLMTMMTLVRAGDSGRDNLNQWMIGLLYSVPSTMLGMGGSQIFRNISQFLIFDIGTEGVQALSSAGIGSILESTGLQAKRDLTTWQRVRQEFVDGVMYFGVGRGVGAAIPKVPGVVARIQQTYPKGATGSGQDFKEQAETRTHTGEGSVHLRGGAPGKKGEGGESRGIGGR